MVYGIIWLAGIITSWFVILKHIITLALNCCCSNVSHESCFSMSVTLVLSNAPYLFMTYRTPLLCTISMGSLRVAWWGLYTVEAYPTVGCTSAMYALSLVFLEAVLMFRLIKPSILLPLAFTLLECWCHPRSLDTPTPKYVAFSTVSRTIPLR